jgi:hypothetical protein
MTYSAQWYFKLTLLCVGVFSLCSFVQLYTKLKRQQNLFICWIQNCLESQLKILVSYSPTTTTSHSYNLYFIMSSVTQHCRMSTFKIKALMSNFLYNFCLLIKKSDIAVS